MGNIVSARNQRHGIPVIESNTYGMTYGALIMLTLSLITGQEFSFEMTALYRLATIPRFFCHYNCILELSNIAWQSWSRPRSLCLTNFSIGRLGYFHSCRRISMVDLCWNRDRPNCDWKLANTQARNKRYFSLNYSKRQFLIPSNLFNTPTLG